MQEFTDNTLMPFGKFGPDQGNQKRLGEIHADYFIWLWDNGLYLEDALTEQNETRHKLHLYIHAALDELETESGKMAQHRPKPKYKR